MVLAGSDHLSRTDCTCAGARTDTGTGARSCAVGMVWQRRSSLGKAQVQDERTADQLIEWCKGLQKDRIHKLVDTLAAELGITLPEGRVVVNWDEVREMSQGGFPSGRILARIES